DAPMAMITPQAAPPPGAPVGCARRSSHASRGIDSGGFSPVAIVVHRAFARRLLVGGGAVDQTIVQIGVERPLVVVAVDVELGVFAWIAVDLAVVRIVVVRVVALERRDQGSWGVRHGASSCRAAAAGPRGAPAGTVRTVGSRGNGLAPPGRA